MGTRSDRDTVHIATRVTPEQVDAIDLAADACGMARATWIRTVLLAACGVSPLRDQLTRAKARAKRKGAGK